MYDVLLRIVMVSYYIVGLNEFSSTEQYLQVCGGSKWSLPLNYSALFGPAPPVVCSWPPG